MSAIQDSRGSSPNGVEDPWKGAIGSFSPSKWIVDAASARALIASGAMVIRARGSGPKASRPVRNAVPVSWQHFSNGDAPMKGRLLDDDMVLTQRLRALGISEAVSALVVDDPKVGGGEAGRLTWTFRTLGHAFTYLVDGGIDALAESEILPINPPPISGDFTVARDLRFQSRGGHVPGAKHLFYKALLSSDGKVLPRDQIHRKLTEIGVKENDEVVSYCTGGVRAGFVTVLLNDAGIAARNYAGSMWEWSASPADQYPLNKNGEG